MIIQQKKSRKKMGTDHHLRRNNIKHHERFSVKYPFQYVLQEQRYVCLLIGIVISCLVFNVIPSSAPPENGPIAVSHESTWVHGRVSYGIDDGFSHFSAGMIRSCKDIRFYSMNCIYVLLIWRIELFLWRSFVFFFFYVF